MIVRFPVKPSPNLPTWQSIYLYPSLCLFEGTIVSIGRGTDFPFEIIGHPEINSREYRFTPRKIPGVAENPPFQGKECYGQNLRTDTEHFNEHVRHFNLAYLMEYYQQLGLGQGFFNSYFEKLAGNADLRTQVRDGVPEDQIRDSWKNGIDQFKSVRKKYLLYPDF
jgi:uncharacterized protein YbbC (DUF1343 family)